MRQASARSSSVLSRAAFLALLTGLAGCSSDASRLGPSPWGVPTASNTTSSTWGNSSSTASLNTQSDYTGSIASKPLPPVSASAYTGYRPSAAAQPAAMSQASGSLVVQPGDSIYGLARRNNVSASSLMAANNISDANSIKIGQRLVMPGVSTAAVPASYTPQKQASFTPPQPALQNVRGASTGGSYTVANGDSLYSIARQHNLSPGELARANNFGAQEKLSAGRMLVIPGQQSFAASAPAVSAAPVAVSAKSAKGDVFKPAMQQAERVAPRPPVETVAAVAAPAQLAAAPVAKTAKTTPDETASLPEPGSMSDAEFRWPVRGRVVGNYGPQQGGGRNNGINIAVPAGTPVKAAENGVVAYAGSELKGYGNLVLIRHQGDFVTAYAHNSEVSVKRGDTVKRGQVIGKAGQSGTVSQPQLHFEIRKGSTPIDPMTHLSSE